MPSVNFHIGAFFLLAGLDAVQAIVKIHFAVMIVLLHIMNGPAAAGIVTDKGLDAFQKRGDDDSFRGALGGVDIDPHLAFFAAGDRLDKDGLVLQDLAEDFAVALFAGIHDVPFMRGAADHGFPILGIQSLHPAFNGLDVQDLDIFLHQDHTTGEPAAMDKDQIAASDGRQIFA